MVRLYAAPLRASYSGRGLSREEGNYEESSDVQGAAAGADRAGGPADGHVGGGGLPLIRSQHRGCYRWRDQLFENADRLLEKKGQGPEALGQLEAENQRLKEVIAEITSENLDPRKSA